MLKACKYCGRIHSFEYQCPLKPKSLYVRNKDIERFRNSGEWKSKRLQIKERDKDCCVACWHNLQGTIRRINTDGLSVHHIKSLVKAWALRLVDNNLITLCDYHHEQAEKGSISEQVLFDLVVKGVHISPPEYPKEK